MAVDAPRDWRGYDRSELDAQYSPSRTAKDFSGAIDYYSEGSISAKRIYERRALLDQRYANGPRALADVFPARDNGRAPVHMFIHGGFWQELSKEYAAFPAPAFVRAGSAFVALNYTLAPQARLSEIIREIRSAVAWARKNAASFGGDPDNIVVSGHSAGAYLAATLISTAGAHPVPGLRGLCLISGVFDLEPVRRCYVNDALGLRQEEIPGCDVVLNSPVQDVPVEIFVGNDETSEFRRQSLYLFETWAPRLTNCAHTSIEGRDHFDILFDLASPTGPVFKAALKLASGDTRDDQR